MQSGRLLANFTAFKCTMALLSISANFSMQHSTSSLGISQVHCEVQKFISEFASQFVNKDCDWPFNSMKPIKFLIHNPVCEFRNELLNFATNLRTSQRTSECSCEKLAEIDNK